MAAREASAAVPTTVTPGGMGGMDVNMGQQIDRQAAWEGGNSVHSHAGASAYQQNEQRKAYGRGGGGGRPNDGYGTPGRNRDDGAKSPN